MAIIEGTANNDDLFITNGVSGDTILGLGGNDRLDAGFGAGANILRGGTDNDQLFAFFNDQLFGEAGNDELSATDGKGGNTLSGGDDNDRIFASFNDSIFGDRGEDEIFGGLGGNTIAGGLGKDIFWLANVDVPNNPNTITDFNPVSDAFRIDLAGVTKISDLAIAQSGADSTISFNDKTLAIVKNTLIANLNPTNILFEGKNATVNLAPVITATTFIIDENSKVGTVVGKVSATDPNVGDLLTFSITVGNNDLNANGKSPFAINAATGEITVNDSDDLDFERNSSIGIRIKASDLEELSSEAQITVSLNDLSESSPTSSKVTSFDFTNLPKLGTTSKGQDILLGGFSGLSFQGTNATNGNLRFITITDRGPNGDPTGANRPFFLPDFQPEIVAFELNRTTGKIVIGKRTGLFRADGTTKLTGLPNLQAGANGTAFTDEIGVDLDGKVLTNDVLGIDSEGIVVDDNGNYWVVDEYRPAIYQFDVNGKLLDRFVPEGTAASPAGTANDFPSGTFGKEVLPAVYAQRRANRGFEAVALEGNKLYAFIQSAIDNPDSAGDTTSRNSRNLRILEFDVVTQKVTGEYLYILDNITGSGNFRTDKIGDAVSLGNGKFAVVERDDLSTVDSNKLIYQIDLKDATNINNSASLSLPSGKTIEQLSPSELIAANIKPVSKNLIANAAKSGYIGVEKLEGLALVAPNTLALINDNDFNVVTTVPEKLGILELGASLPVSLNFRKNDADTFAISGGTTAKPSTSFTVKNNGANQVSELGLFIVDDAAGIIDGIALNQSGYAEKALERSKVIFSAIANNPDAFSANGLNRLLEFDNNAKFRFYTINDKTATTDSILQSKSFDKVTFSSTTSLNFNTLGTNSFSINFNNLEINIQGGNDDLLLGTNSQGNKQGELIDLRDVNTALFPKVQADFTVNREAAFDNFVGFYKVENAIGDIKKADGTIVKVGESGYTQAAVQSRVSGIDLSVSNQGTQTSSGVFAAGSIFAPFIIIDGRPDAILDSNPSNNPDVFFSYLGANSDGVDHVRLLGNNTFGFEDLRGGGDFDYNDVIVKIKLTPIA